MAPTEDCVGGVHLGLVFGSISDKAPRVGEGNVRWSGSVALSLAIISTRSFCLTCHECLQNAELYFYEPTNPELSELT